MRPRIPRSAFVGAALAGCLLLSSTGGALAGAMITGAQIKNNTVTTKDIRNRTLVKKDLSAGAIRSLAGARGPQGPQGAAGSPGISGYQTAVASKAVAAATPSSLSVNCPAGKNLLGGTGYWSTSNAAVQVYYDPAGEGITVYTTGIPGADALNARVVCAEVG